LLTNYFNIVLIIHSYENQMALLPLMSYADVYQQIKMYTFSALCTLFNWYVIIFYVIKHIFMFLHSRETQLCWFCFRKFLCYGVDRSCISIRWCREMGMWPRHCMSSDCVWLRLLLDVEDSCKCSKWVAVYRRQWVNLQLGLGGTNVISLWKQTEHCKSLHKGTDLGKFFEMI
jgi:hypothetical protein